MGRNNDEGRGGDRQRRALRAQFVPDTIKSGQAIRPIDRSLARGLTFDVPIERLQQRPILEIVTTSALALLVDPRDLARIKLCPGEDCG